MYQISVEIEQSFFDFARLLVVCLSSSGSLAKHVQDCNPLPIRMAA